MYKTKLQISFAFCFFFKTNMNPAASTVCTFFIPLNPKRGQHLISSYRNTAEPFIKIMRIKKMTANLRSFDLQINSPCQYQKKHIEKSVENIDNNVRVQRVIEQSNNSSEKKKKTFPFCLIFVSPMVVRDKKLL